MSVGAILLTATGAGLDGHGFMIFYIISQFVFGYGVGGEYPMAAGSAAERAEAGGRAKASKRGMEVVLTFSMQGASAMLYLTAPPWSAGAALRWALLTTGLHADADPAVCHHSSFMEGMPTCMPAPRRLSCACLQVWETSPTHWCC